MFRLCDGVSSCVERNAFEVVSQELWLETQERRAFLNITPQVKAALKESGVREGLALINAMHITASVFINDDEWGCTPITTRGSKSSRRMSRFRATAITETLTPI
jgi:hypothetical protein